MQAEVLVHSGNVYMVLAVLSFSSIGAVAKLADLKNSRPSTINLLLYLSSFLVLVVVALVSHSAASPQIVKLLALPFGVCSALAILALQTALRYGNISTSWLAINLSAGIPTVGSILLYHERLNLRKSCALLLIVVALALLWKDKKMEGTPSR
ncbi:MAG TPA: EamA family transporter [Bryobacteraceae bacterium]|jgi:drug/metabolite transporter (DMT)-like permease